MKNFTNKLNFMATLTVATLTTFNTSYCMMFAKFKPAPSVLDELKESGYVKPETLTLVRKYNHETDYSAAHANLERNGLRHLFKPSDHEALVYVQDGCLVGVSAFHHPFGHPLAQLHLLSVNSDDQKKGVGTVLLYGTLKHVQAHGARNVQLEADPSSQKFYEKYGFQFRRPYDKGDRLTAMGKL